MVRESRLGEAKCDIIKNAAKQRVKQLKQEKEKPFYFSEWGGGGDKDTERDRQTDKQTDRQTDRQRLLIGHCKTKCETDTDRYRDTERDF